jgi:hypothetical protein
MILPRKLEKTTINVHHSRESGNPENLPITSGFRVKPGMTGMFVFFVAEPVVS